MMHSVTTVGATTQIPEIAANFSGGGFSNYVRLLYPLRPRPSDGSTSVPTPGLARGRSYRVLSIATGWHLRGALQLLRTRMGPQLRDRVLCMTVVLTGIPGRLGTGNSLPDRLAGAHGACRGHVSLGTIVRCICRLVERRADRRGQVLARLPQSDVIRVKWSRIARHHGWERPGMRHTWVQREFFLVHPHVWPRTHG